MYNKQHPKVSSSQDMSLNLLSQPYKFQYLKFLTGEIYMCQELMTKTFVLCWLGFEKNHSVQNGFTQITRNLQKYATAE
jgi:hypothetical protein